MSVATKSKIVLRQVLMRRTDGDRQLEDVYWIDAEVARVGKRVRDEDGSIWTVIETYGAKSFDDVDAQRDAWKRWAGILDGH